MKAKGTEGTKEAKKNPLMKITGILMILFAIVYITIVVLVYNGSVEGILPGHESEEMLVAVVSTAVATFSFTGGVCALTGSKLASKIIGVIFVLAGLGSLIYLQLTQDTFNIVDFIGVVLGIMLVVSASKKETK